MFVYKKLFHKNQNQKANHFYNEDLNDCFPQQEFGQPCESNIECLPDNLACDLSPTGEQTKMCSLLPGGRCSDSNDCVHSLDCVHGHCKCKVSSKSNQIKVFFFI